MDKKSNKLISQEELSNFFEGKFSENETKRHFESVKKFLSKPNEDDSSSVRDFLLWAKHSSNLKVSSFEVPTSILSNAILHDIKVESRGPDDVVYDKNPEFRAKIARGNSILEYSTTNGTKKLDLIVYALRKFTGGLGDEDEIDRKKGDWKKYFLKDFKSIKHVISLQKANGEAAHLSCSWIDNDFLISAGSKNVHIVFRNKDDIYKYSESRYSYARIISEAVIDHLNRMDSNLKNRFLSFLCWSKLTVILEVLIPTSQHIEDLSYLKEYISIAFLGMLNFLNQKVYSNSRLEYNIVKWPLLKFITFTENKVVENPTNLCSMPPDCAIEIGKIFDLSCVNCEKIPVNEVDNYLVKVREAHGYEGVVLYFLDSDYNVIGLLKKKTTWYIILRAVREKLRNYLSPKSNSSIEDLQNKVKKRLTEIQNWIGFTEADYKKWEKICIDFVLWFDKNYKSNLISKDDHNSKFPVVWNQFLKEANISDHVDLKIEKEISSNMAEENSKLDSNLEKNSQEDSDKNDFDKNLENMNNNFKKL